MGSTTESAREQNSGAYFKRGIGFALASGICYGLYTAFLTLAETQGEWANWFSGAPWGDGMAPLGTFAVAFALAALAAGLNDLISGIWSLLACVRNQQLGDLWKTVRSKPGWVMMVCAVVGGPFATVAYVVGLNFATAAGNPGAIVPVAALNCAIGAVLGRIFFKQDLGSRKILGIIICLAAGAIIGGTGFAAPDSGVLIGCGFALIAAFCWGFEGCVAGFGTSLIDYRIGICIRQLTAGIIELAVMYPLLMAVGGDSALTASVFSAAIGNPLALIFVISGFFAMPAFSFWYKGNSMCGTALGMACNGMYAFWGPFFIWLVMGVLGIGGLSEQYPPLSAVQWVGAVIMAVGIFVIAIDKKDLAERIGSRKIL